MGYLKYELDSDFFDKMIFDASNVEPVHFTDFATFTFKCLPEYEDQIINRCNETALKKVIVSEDQKIDFTCDISKSLIEEGAYNIILQGFITPSKDGENEPFMVFLTDKEAAFCAGAVSSRLNISMEDLMKLSYDANTKDSYSYLTETLKANLQDKTKAKTQER